MRSASVSRWTSMSPWFGESLSNDNSNSLPSGEKTASYSGAFCEVSRSSFPDFTSRRNKKIVSPRCRAKTTCCPSGDQQGRCFKCPSFVSRITSGSAANELEQIELQPSLRAMTMLSSQWRQLKRDSWASALLSSSERGGVSPLALTLLTRSVSEGDGTRGFPLLPSLTLRVSKSK